MQTFYVMLSIGLIFGALGALAAYLITYKEWEHHYPTPEIPRRLALETAIFAFALFVGIALLVGIFIK
ncbi:MAG TPA: hypothetical protein VHZ04_03430 [Candidatus Paceibacterota bacterium]|nr:hypothetical protein [Candidatus Paceibacterota bacterium]